MHDEVTINISEERGNITILLVDAATEQDEIACWRDDDVADMVDAGFFTANKGKRALAESVVRYAEDIGLVAKYTDLVRVL